MKGEKIYMQKQKSKVPICGSEVVELTLSEVESVVENVLCLLDKSSSSLEKLCVLIWDLNLSY